MATMILLLHPSPKQLQVTTSSFDTYKYKIICFRNWNDQLWHPTRSIQSLEIKSTSSETRFHPYADSLQHYPAQHFPLLWWWWYTWKLHCVEMPVKRLVWLTPFDLCSLKLKKNRILKFFLRLPKKRPKGPKSEQLNLENKINGRWRFTNKLYHQATFSVWNFTTSVPSIVNCTNFMKTEWQKIESDIGPWVKWEWHFSFLLSHPHEMAVFGRLVASSQFFKIF